MIKISIHGDVRTSLIYWINSLKNWDIQSKKVGILLFIKNNLPYK